MARPNRHALAVDDDLADFKRRFRADPLLGPLIRRLPWLRVRRCPSPWEAFAWAVTEQLIESREAARIQRRIVQRWGTALSGPPGARPLADVPGPEVVAALAPAELVACDLAPKRALALVKAAREIASGRFGPKGGIVVPYPDDMRYRSWEPKLQPQSNAVIVYMMDVSGSMGDEQKEIVRIEAFWIDTWLKSQYRHIETRYIVHDAEAKEVDEHTFFHLRESGGTKISSAYALAADLVGQHFPASEWNIYLFHFSDGDNWSGRDTEKCLSLLKERLLPDANLFCYGQVKSAYGSGQFKKDLDQALSADTRVISAEILDREGILPAIKAFLGKGL